MTEHTKATTPAQKKRRPFVIKNGEHSQYIHCSRHPAEVATFYCAKCHDPFGEECVGEEIGEQTICSACVGSNIKNEVNQLEKKKRNRRIRNISVAGVTAILLCLNAFVLIRYSPTSDEISQPELSKQVSELIKCRHNLEAIAEQTKFYLKAIGRLPDSINEIKDILKNPDQALEPITAKPYLIQADEHGAPKIVCPSPEAHGLASLFALPGKPARMQYKKTTHGNIQ
ncbi:MAG: hypothetical protein ABUK11_00010 [Mariprofundaceae bacterium]